MKQLQKALFIVSLIAAGLSAVACNTTKGLGTDIERAGSGLKGSAERNGAK